MTQTPADKTIPPSSLFTLVRYLVGGSLLSLILRLVAGVIQARLLLPSTLGLFNSIGLILQYAPFLQLGINCGLYRELPYHLGQGERERALELSAAAQAWSIILALVLSILFLGISLWYLAHAEFWKAAGWFTNIFLAIALFYNTNYLQVTFRTSHDFKRLALVGIIESIASLVLLLLVVWLNFYGLCLRAITVGIIGTGLLFFWRPIRVSPKWNLPHLKHLLRIGFPIFIVGQMYSWWSALNLTLVLKLTGVEGVGLYAMVSMATAAFEFVPSAVNQVLFPRMAEQYGKTGRISEQARIAVKPMILTAIVMVVLASAAWWLIDPMLRYLAPNYTNATTAMQWGLLQVFTSSFYPASSLLQIIGKQAYYGIALVIAMLFYIATLFWLTHEAVHLEAFPQAMLVGRSLYAIICMIMVFYLFRREHAHQGLKNNLYK